jgi:predicted nucleic acid-binding protein
MKKILLDTDILIEHLRDNFNVMEQLLELQQDPKVLLAYTPVTEAEIIRGLRSHERQKTEKVLGYFDVIVMNKEVGRVAGNYLRKYASSHGLKLADALIAATASVHHFSLCTFNIRYYPMQDIKYHRIDR